MLKKPFNYLKYSKLAILLLVLQFSSELVAQVLHETLPAKVTLTDCIDYALQNQPAVRQSILDEDITRQDIRIALSGWLPQFNAGANLQHNLKLPVVFFPNPNDPTGPKQQATSGLFNTSAIQFTANQTIYDTELFFATKTAKEIGQLSKENIQRSKIDLVVDVSKAFYAVLLSQQQLQILDEDIIRLDKNLKDAFSLYKNGVTEKTDYQRTTIALNNAKAEKKGTVEAVKVKYAYLKQLMGTPINQSFTILYDSISVEKEIFLDTLQIQNYNNRPEFQALQTSLMVQHSKAGYYKWSFLPEISAFAGYNINYQNDRFSQLYNKSFPNSLIGLKLSLPLFNGTVRLENLKKANLQYDRLNLDLINLRSQINTEYTQAMAAYKSNLNELHSAKENVNLAREIFKTVKLQYDKGVVVYLEVIVAETDLRTAELNYLNVLFRVISSKLDVKKALGNITVN
jgi:outer membrane protein TolC